VPREIIEIYREVTIAIDITFANKVPFFVTMAPGIQFGTIEALTNRQILSVRDCLKKVVSLYVMRGFRVSSILADNEFEPLRQWYPALNTCAANEHVPEIEQYIRTVKDRSRSTYRMLSFRYLPRIVLVHLLRNAVFWLNAFPHEDGATQKYSPWYIMTGQYLSFAKHAVIEFGAYVQTHEEPTNNMGQRTMGCICLGPTGNCQGAHWFMSLSLGECVVRYRWTELPMPRAVIDWVSAIGRWQHMPSTITYADRHGNEIGDTINELDDDMSDDDSSYLDSHRDDDSMNSDSDDVSSSDNGSSSDDESDGDNDDDDVDDDFDGRYHQPNLALGGQPQPRDQPVQPNDDVGGGDDGGDWGLDNQPNCESESVLEDQPIEERLEENSTLEDQSVDEDAVSTDQGVGDAVVPNEDMSDGEEDCSDAENGATEFDWFQEAEAQGRNDALLGESSRPKRQTRSTRQDDYVYASIALLIDDVMQKQCLMTAQMSARAGLKQFGKKERRQSCKSWGSSFL
jgi:hypothetical protein